MCTCFLLLAALAVAEAVVGNSLPARELAKNLEHQRLARDMSANRIEKRYPPDRETFTRTTTPVWMASQTPTASASSPPSSAATPTTTAPPGQFGTPTSRALVAATTSSATTCAPAYVTPPMIYGTGTFPEPTAFVCQRAACGQALMGDGNQPYVIIGPNMYWLCQDKNYGPAGSCTDKSSACEALASVVAMGANTMCALS
ncbi:hypothetical protein JCM6882_005089 [Rhodosporidiobolus microsporus]